MGGAATLHPVRMPAEELTQPPWLVAGARVVVRCSSSSSGRVQTLTVTGIEWPWLVWFLELPGATHGGNVLRLADDPGP